MAISPVVLVEHGDNIALLYDFSYKNPYEIPTNPLGKAVAYALNQRSALEKFLYDPQINIDNNPAENVIRPIALGRKNWLFFGSEEGGMNLAILASFAAT